MLQHNSESSFLRERIPHSGMWGGVTGVSLDGQTRASWIPRRLPRDARDGRASACGARRGHEHPGARDLSISPRVRPRSSPGGGRRSVQRLEPHNPSADKRGDDWTIYVWLLPGRTVYGFKVDGTFWLDPYDEERMPKGRL